MVTLLMGNSETETAGGEGGNDGLWIPAGEVEAATGWTMKPEGFCHEEVCVLVPPERKADFVRDGQVNVAAFWRHMGRPALHDEAGKVWVLGESAGNRAAQLATLEAPDFTLPDLEGKLHRLSDYRGRKVLLVTWASW